MELVNAKCTNCGGTLDVNPEAECLICKYCGSPFIVSKAINNYNTSINSNVTNINADIVMVNGYDEKVEIQKARKLIGKDDNLASQIYQKIFENNPDNYEARYLRIFLNKEVKTVNVKKMKLEYNAALRMNINKEEFHQEDQPLYSESDKEDARNALFKEVISRNDEEIKPFLCEIFSLEYLSRFRIVFHYDNGFSLIPHGTMEIMLFLYSKEDVVEALKETVEFYQKCYKEWADTHYKKIVTETEDRILTLEPTYQKVTLVTDKKSGGCYVATCVYGSYDCPEVWVLRRYRDYKLNNTRIGRAFIKVYYAISPTLVKWFGHTNWFKNMWRGALNRMVKKYKSLGYEDTPYNDIY